MVLVDTSVWVAHFRKSNACLQEMLDKGDVSTHPFVIGELACGGLGNRAEVLALIQALPTSPVLSQEEFLHVVDAYRLAGRVIGFVDVHLLGSALMRSDFLWTLDTKLDAVARKLKIAFR